MPNLVRTTVRLSGSLSDLAVVLSRLENSTRKLDATGESQVGSLRCDQSNNEGVVLEIVGIAPWTVPLDEIKALVGNSQIDLEVHGFELSNAWIQDWELHNGQWSLIRCLEDVFIDDEPDGEPEIYVEEGRQVKELPLWVAQPEQ